MAEEAPTLLGRRKIYTGYDEITRENVVSAVNDAYLLHMFNASAINYLYLYRHGDQPILQRTKTIRPEINNKIVENRAFEIHQFWASWLMSEPCTYVRRGERSSVSPEIQKLNDYMFSEGKDTLDVNLVSWMCDCGVGYRMVLPDTAKSEDDAPFEVDVLDPRDTFVVYHTGFGHKKMMGCMLVPRIEGNEIVRVICGYTDTHYFEVKSGVLARWDPHILGGIPIFEYAMDDDRAMGVFEPALFMLNAINTVASNRTDGIEQFIQALVKFINCDISAEDFAVLAALGAIKVKSSDGVQADVELMSQELNQSETQTLVDHMYQTVLTICGVPTTNRTQGGSSDNGVAVQLRQGWEQSESRARKFEKMFKGAERDFLKMALSLIKSKEPFDVKLIDIDIVFSRRNTNNIVSTSQSLLQLLEAGIAPEEAIRTIGIWSDPLDVFTKSKQFLKKWDYEEPDDSTLVIADANAV